MKKALFLLLFFSLSIFGQNQTKIDSLKTVITNSNLVVEKASTYIAWADLVINKNNTASEEKLLHALNLIEYKEQPKLLAKIYHRLGLIYYKKENDDLAMNYFIKSDSISNKNNIIDEDLVYTKFYQAQILKFSYTKEGLLKSKQYLNEMLNYANRLNDSLLINWSYQKMGGFYGAMSETQDKSKNQDTAVFYFTKAKNFFKKNKNYLKLNTTLWSLASIEENRRNFEEAKKYHDLRILEINNVDDTSEKGIVYKSVANFYIKIKRPKEALLFLEKANKNFKRFGFPNSRDKIEMYTNQALAYSLLGDYKKAYNFIRLEMNAKDSINRESNKQRALELETKYQTEKKEQQITLLTSQNELVEQQKTNQRNIFLGGIGLTAIAGLFFFFQYRNRQKTNIKLRQLDKAKSTFFANISHEFRTPLTLIKGPLDDQLNSDVISNIDRKNLLVAKSNTIRLESLVEQLLALSKLESGNLRLRVQPGNLPQFIKAQAEAFSFNIKEKHIDFKIRIEDDSYMYWFDQDALEKILFNLLGNAIKYTNEGGEISVVGGRSNKNYIFSVTNSGQAITEANQEKIFERFYQSSSQNSGTGIGLSLTKELVELHKGAIVVKSSEKGVNQFTVTIRVSKESFLSSEMLSEELQTQRNDFVELLEDSTTFGLIPSEDTPVLLIVDDNIEIINYIASIFESTYQIETAKNGKEGFETAISLIPDIIISDVMMPIEDGFTLTKKLKENELTSHIPIVLLTAKTEDKDKLEGIYSGADTYITKPFNSQLLKATLNNLLENRRKLQARFAQEVILKPRDIAISSADEQFLERLQKVMDTHLDNPSFNVDMFSNEMAVSRMQLHRKLKAISGQSAIELLKSQRLKAATHLLKTSKISISEVGYAVGFNDPSYFTRCFKREYGCSPSEFISK